MRETDCEGKRFFDGGKYDRISLDWKFNRCKSRVYTVADESAKLPRKSIRNKNCRRKKVSQLLLRYFSITEKRFRLIGRIVVIAFNALYAQNPRIR